MTLGQFYALHRLHAQAREREELYIGILASVIANFSMAAPKKPLKPSDFGLGPKVGRRHMVSEEQTAAQEFAAANQWRIIAGKPQLSLANPEVLNAT